MYFVNIEVWVEAENALGKVASDHINFDPIDKGIYKPKFENLLEYTMSYKFVLSLINVKIISIYFLSDFYKLTLSRTLKILWKKKNIHNPTTLTAVFTFNIISDIYSDIKHLVAL